jgi:hypothetical protein
MTIPKSRGAEFGLNERRNVVMPNSEGLGDGGFVVTIDGLHHLHCLVRRAQKK